MDDDPAGPFHGRECALDNGSRARTNTCIVTSAGIRSRSISSRQKSKSVCEAEGNPTRFLEANLHQHREHAALASGIHRLKLIPGFVPQIDDTRSVVCRSLVRATGGRAAAPGGLVCTGPRVFQHESAFSRTKVEFRLAILGGPSPMRVNTRNVPAATDRKP